MIERYLRLAEFLDPADKQIAEFLLSPAENIRVNDLFLNMEKLQSVTLKLQEKHVNLSVVQTLFKSLLEDYPQMSHYLGTEEGSLTHNPAFELGIVNIIDGVTLYRRKKRQLRFLTNRPKYRKLRHLGLVPCLMPTEFWRNGERLPVIYHGCPVREILSNDYSVKQSAFRPTAGKKCFTRTLKCKCSSLQTNLFGMLNLLNQ